MSSEGPLFNAVPSKQGLTPSPDAGPAPESKALAAELVSLAGEAQLHPESDPAFVELTARVLALQPTDNPSAIERSGAGILLDKLAVRVARGRGALDVRLGRVLDLLNSGSRLERLGYVRIADYATEELGLARSAAYSMARLAHELRARPLLRVAVESGTVSTRKAEAILPVTGRNLDEEARWVERARTDTVRALRAAVALATTETAAAAAAVYDERWRVLAVPLPEESRATVARALDVARRHLGGAAPGWQCLEVMAEEYLGGHPELEPPELETALGWVPRDLGNDLQLYFETELRGWTFLDHTAPAVPAQPDPVVTDAFELHARAKALVGARERWDRLVGHLAMIIKRHGLWRDMQFASFGHYCRERLGLSARGVEQRQFLERRLYEVPPLAKAMREGRLGYSKSLSLARHYWQRLGNSGMAASGVPQVEAEIAWAQEHTCQELQAKHDRLARERFEGDAAPGARTPAEPEGGAHTCGPSSVFERMPESAAKVVRGAMVVAKTVAALEEGRFIGDGEALGRIAAHFLEVWEAATPRRRGYRRHPEARSKGICEAPGCTRAANHVHHKDYRSHQGSDAPENLVDTCAGHHLRCIHAGFMRVHGDATKELVWELGIRNGVPLRTIVTRAS